MSRQPLVNINPSDANCLLQLLLQLLPPFSYVCSQRGQQGGSSGAGAPSVCMQILLHLQLLLLPLAAAATANNYSNIVATATAAAAAADVAVVHLVVRAKWQLLCRLMIITRRPRLLSILT